MIFFTIFFLISACSVLNHLGGQSTAIPKNRIVCRIVLISLAFSSLYPLYGASPDHFLILIALMLAGMTLWAVPAWGEGFMAIHGQDKRDYSKYLWMKRITDLIVGTRKHMVLGYPKCRDWGTVFMSLRGGFMYPLFIGLAFLLTKWALVYGIGCFAQGVIYRTSPTVLIAEYRFGALIGLMLGLTLITM